MSEFLNSSASAYRLSRAISAAIVLGGILLWALWNPAPKMTSQTTEMGRIISVIRDGVTVIELADGRQVRSFTPYPLPRRGDQIPMRVETYEDGSTLAVIDVQRWQGL